METKKIAYSVSPETSKWIDFINRFDEMYNEVHDFVSEIYPNPENSILDELYDTGEAFREFLYKCLTTGIRENLSIYNTKI